MNYPAASSGVSLKALGKLGMSIGLLVCFLFKVQTLLFCNFLSSRNYLIYCSRNFLGRKTTRMLFMKPLFNQFCKLILISNKKKFRAFQNLFQEMMICCQFESELFGRINNGIDFPANRFLCTT